MLQLDSGGHEVGALGAVRGCESSLVGSSRISAPPGNTLTARPPQTRRSTDTQEFRRTPVDQADRLTHRGSLTPNRCESRCKIFLHQFGLLVCLGGTAIVLGSVRAVATHWSSRPAGLMRPVGQGRSEIANFSATCLTNRFDGWTCLTASLSKFALKL